MGEAANVAAESAEVVDNDDSLPEGGEQEPYQFETEIDDKPAEPDEKKEDKTEAKPDETSGKIDALTKEIEGLKQKASESYWRGEYFKMRNKREAEKPAESKAPPFTKAQLLRVLEEHQGEPAVQLQVWDSMLESALSQNEKKFTETAEITAKKSQTESWLRQNAPALFDDGSELRMQTDTMRQQMKLEDHPLGDFLAVAAAQMAAYPEMLKKEVEKAREEERKKLLGETSEKARKGAIKGAAPAGGKRSPSAAGAADEATYIKQAKGMGLTGDAVTEYVKIRKNAAKNSKTIMEA
jgi:hypothetical protein